MHDPETTESSETSTTPGANSPQETESSLAISALRETLATVKADRDELFERLARTQAEFENARKRIEREKSDFLQYANAELMRELLSALDSFELALKDVPGDEKAAGYRKGFELIYKQLVDVLSRFGLQRIEAEGLRFDPNLHQAVASEENSEFEENTVLHELRRGYTLNGRLLRAVMVSVSKRSGS